jgi:4-hydroxybenzoyl-CoA thioesterase
MFFPNYLMLCHEVMEDWVNHGLGISYADLFNTRGLGIPAVKATTEYLAPSKFGDELSFELMVIELGNKSMTLSIRAHGNGQERMRTELIVVVAQINPFKAIRIPDDLRDKIMPFTTQP